MGVFAVHDTISNQNPSCHSDVVLAHYRRVAGSLTFGKTPLGRLDEGGSNGRQGARGAVERMRVARKAQAAHFAANVLPIIRDMEAAVSPA